MTADIRKWLENVAQKPQEMAEMMRRNNLVIRDHDDPMQKLAFTLYTEIVVQAASARELLDEEEDG